MIRLLLAGTFLFGWMCASTDAAEINIGYLRRPDPKPTLSLIQTPANNDGIAGARLAIGFVPIAGRGHHDESRSVDWLAYYNDHKLLLRFTRPPSTGWNDAVVTDNVRA